MFDKEKHIAYWKNGAKDDWEFAHDAVKLGRTRHGLFFAHLSFEKALKARVAKKISDVPPKTHNLVKLAEMAGIELNDQQLAFFDVMNSYQLSGRYPEDLSKPPSVESALKILADTREIFEWLMNLS